MNRAYRYVSRTIAEFIDDDCTTMAAAVAYYTSFSLAPLLLIVISIVGLIFGRQVVQHDVQAQIQGLIGQVAAGELVAMLKNAGEQKSTGILSSALGALALLFGATGAFSQLQSSLNAIWHIKPDPKAGGIRNFLFHRILSFGMILAIAFLLLVSLAVSAALAAFADLVSGFLPGSFSGPLLQATTFAISLVIIAALFAAIFKVLPDVIIGWRVVWVGAIITAVLFDAGKLLIGLYLGRSSTVSVYGAAGSFVLLILWIYYSSLIFLLGAEFSRVWGEDHEGSVKPKPGAVHFNTYETVDRGRVA